MWKPMKSIKTITVLGWEYQVKFNRVGPDGEVETNATEIFSAILNEQDPLVIVRIDGEEFSAGFPINRASNLCIIDADDDELLINITAIAVLLIQHIADYRPIKREIRVNMVAAHQAWANAMRAERAAKAQFEEILRIAAEADSLANIGALTPFLDHNNNLWDFDVSFDDDGTPNPVFRITPQVGFIYED